MSFVGPDGPRLAVVGGDLVVDLTAVDTDAPSDLRHVIRAGRLPELQRGLRIQCRLNGDVVEVEIEAVGTLVNHVQDEVA